MIDILVILGGFLFFVVCVPYLAYRIYRRFRRMQMEWVFRILAFCITCGGMGLAIAALLAFVGFLMGRLAATGNGEWYSGGGAGLGLLVGVWTGWNINKRTFI